jgi:beta-D-xylosidase 4
MIGFWADNEKHLHGDYSGKAPYSHTPAWAAEKLGFQVYAADGPITDGDESDDNWTKAAVEAAEKSDHIVYFGGLHTGAASEGFDRTSIAWPHVQLELLAKLSTLGKPITVIQLGDQLDNTPLLENDSIAAILWASWPGQEGGTAIMSLLTGAESPAGRLPVTQYPAKYVDDIPMSTMKLRPTSGYPGRTYRWYDNAVQPFGYGLHYTDFDVSLESLPQASSIQELVESCSEEFLDLCPFTSLRVTVKNTGARKSDYVALAFIKGEVGPAPYPIKTLATYTRVRAVEPGNDKSADLQWTLGNLARHDENGNTVLYPGDYTVMLDEPTKVEMKFTLTGKPAVLDQWPKPPAVDGEVPSGSEEL